MKTFDLTTGATRPSWHHLFEQVSHGDVLVVTPALGKAACSAARVRAFRPIGKTEEGKFHITLIAGDEEIKPGSDKNSQIRAAQARHNNIAGRICQAGKEMRYWQDQAILRTDPTSRLQALAAAAAWKMTHQRLQNQLDRDASGSL